LGQKRTLIERQTSTIPILFLNVGDPMAMGLIESLIPGTTPPGSFAPESGQRSERHKSR
jgi:hypothetical protein